MTDLSQKCVIVVNQNAANSIDITRALQRANYRVAGPFELCSDASDWLTNGEADGALLNILLTDDTCFELARDLRSRGVPYLFHSTPPQPIDDPASWGYGPSINVLLQSMSELIAKGARGAAE